MHESNLLSIQSLKMASVVLAPVTNRVNSNFSSLTSFCCRGCLWLDCILGQDCASLHVEVATLFLAQNQFQEGVQQAHSARIHQGLTLQRMCCLGVVLWAGIMACIVAFCSVFMPSQRSTLAACGPTQRHSLSVAA